MGLLGALGLSAGHMISTNGRRSPGIIKVEREGYHFWFPLSLSLAFSVSISLSAHCEKWHPSLKQNTQPFKGVLKLKYLFSKERTAHSGLRCVREELIHPPIKPSRGEPPMESKGPSPGESTWDSLGSVSPCLGRLLSKTCVFFQALSLLSAFSPWESGRRESCCQCLSVYPALSHLTHSHAQTHLLGRHLLEDSYQGKNIQPKKDS